jgi:glycosyltransferase involved in cell wall biosynthesis
MKKFGDETEMSPPLGNAPLLSVIVPTYSRAAHLRRCLLALAGQDLPRERYEVIVVDDGGQVNLEEAVASVRPMKVTLLRQINSGPAAARNRGAAKARGKILVFTDDDCCPPPRWLSNIVTHFESESESILGGNTINSLPENPFATASQMLISYLFRYYNKEAGRAGFVTSNNLAIPEEIYRDAGGFDEVFPRPGGEDRDLITKLLERGHPIFFSPDNPVEHGHPLTLSTYCRQHFNYGRGAYHYHEKHTRCRGANLRPEPLSFYNDLLLAPFEERSQGRSFLLSTLLFISQAANAAGYFFEKGRNSIGS